MFSGYAEPHLDLLDFEDDRVDSATFQSCRNGRQKMTRSRAKVLIETRVRPRGVQNYRRSCHRVVMDGCRVCAPCTPFLGSFVTPRPSIYFANPRKPMLKFLRQRAPKSSGLPIIKGALRALATAVCASSAEKAAYGGLPDQLTKPVNTVASTANMRVSQANNLIGGVVGPNPVSANLLAFRNYHCTANAAVQNPWYAYSLLRGALSN